MADDFDALVAYYEVQAQWTDHQTLPHPEGGTFELHQGEIPGVGSFEVRERDGWYFACANNDSHTIQMRMDEGGLVNWFRRTFS